MELKPSGGAMHRFEEDGRGLRPTKGADVPPHGHESEVRSILGELEQLADEIAEGRTVTDEILDKNWLVWEKRVAKAAEVFKRNFAKLNFSWDPRVIEHIREIASPLQKAIFDKFRNVATEREINKAKTEKREMGGGM